MMVETHQEGNFAYNQPAQPPSLSSAPLAQRRRSLAYSRAPVPPPNIPIPSIPGQLQDSSYPAPPTSDPSDHPYSSVTSPHANGSSARPMFYARPSASQNLSTIAAFPHNMSSNVPDDLSDPPPQSFLPISPRHVERRRRPSGEDGYSSSTAAERKPSSRSALTRALELARQAVHLDSTNDNPAAAVEAYAQSVALLSQVMERVKRGEDGGRRTRSPEAQEEEVKRLQNIVCVYCICL